MYFIDTNIFIYAHDESDPRKTKIARDLIIDLTGSKKGCISTQVIHEFCNAAIKKSQIPLKPADLRLIIKDIMSPLLAHHPDSAFYIRTLEIYQKYSLSFYDAAIVQAALDLNCAIIYSEDLQHEAKIGKLKILNPFK